MIFIVIIFFLVSQSKHFVYPHSHRMEMRQSILRENLGTILTDLFRQASLSKFGSILLEAYYINILQISLNQKKVPYSNQNVDDRPEKQERVRNEK